MADLKPCPFCGRTPIVDDYGDHRYFVRCKWCGIAQDKLYMQKCDAVRRWNTRKTGKIDKDTNVPSTDIINRQAAIDALENIDCSDGIGISALKCDVVEDALNAIKVLPSAQPERKKGRWNDIDAETYTWKIRCDQCGHERSMLSTGQTYPRFCENCGSDMRGDSNG